MRRVLQGRAGMGLAFILGLLIATAGTATAAKLITGRQIKDGTISSKDLSKAVRAQLRKAGVPGPAGSQGPKGDQGPPGQAATPAASDVFAYARIAGDGTLAASAPALNLEQSAISRLSSGQYCLVLPGAKSVMASLATGGNTATVLDVNFVPAGVSSGCPAAANVKVVVRDPASMLTDGGFIVWALR